MTLEGVRTHPITRFKDHYGWRIEPINAVVLVEFGSVEFGDLPMIRRLMRNVKRRAESLRDRHGLGDPGPAEYGGMDTAKAIAA